MGFDLVARQSGRFAARSKPEAQSIVDDGLHAPVGAPERALKQLLDIRVEGQRGSHTWHRDARLSCCQDAIPSSASDEPGSAGWELVSRAAALGRARTVGPGDSGACPPAQPLHRPGKRLRDDRDGWGESRVVELRRTGCAAGNAVTLLKVRGGGRN